MPVPAGRQRARNVGRNEFVEAELYVFGTEPEDRMTADHLDAGTAGDDAELVGIHFLRFEDRGEAVPDGAWGDGDGEQQNEGRGDRHPSLPEPRQVQAGDSGGNPDAPGLTQKDREGDQRAAY